MAQCTAKTKTGNQCLNETVRGTRFCGLTSHQIQGPSNVFQMIGQVILQYWFSILLAFISLIASYVLFTLGPSKSDVQGVKNDMQYLKNRVDKIALARRETFSKQYPQGYQVLAFGNKDIVISKLDTNKNFIMDWTKARILSSDKNQINILLPNIYDVKYHGTLENLVWGFQKSLGKKVFPIEISDYDLMADVLEVTNSGLICVIYFEKKREGDSP